MGEGRTRRRRRRRRGRRRKGGAGLVDWGNFGAFIMISFCVCVLGWREIKQNCSLLSGGKHYSEIILISTLYK